MQPVGQPEKQSLPSEQSIFRALTKREVKVAKAVGAIPAGSIELARGKDKILFHGAVTSDVYMVPRKSFLDKRKKTLEQEVAFCKDLKSGVHTLCITQTTNAQCMHGHFYFYLNVRVLFSPIITFCSSNGRSS